MNAIASFPWPGAVTSELRDERFPAGDGATGTMLMATHFVTDGLDDPIGERPRSFSPAALQRP